jgi:UDP-N-acetylglucosamine:LPS N-acetylglucosamine transferase
VQAIFVAGKNESLRREAEERAAAAGFPIRVVGYTDQMERLMGSSDVMVSKLGGLTTFEALACGVPILGDAVTRPMPQEVRTGHMLERAGAAVMLSSASDLVTAVGKLASDASAYRALRASATALGVPDATKRIVNEIELLFPGVESLAGAAVAPIRSSRLV